MDDAPLSRSCHLCGRAVETRVWYATVKEEKVRTGKRKHKASVRVYACPACFFQELDEAQRAEYRRESLSGLFTGAAL